MEKKALWMLRMVCTLCLILFGTISIIGSTESKDDDKDKESASLNGVWEMKSEIGYDADTGACETTTYGDDFTTYLKFNNNKMSIYGGYDGTVYTCSDDDTTIDITGNNFTDEEDKGWTFDISGDTLTVTAKQADHGCYEKVILTKASESDIENAVSACENDEDNNDDDDDDDDGVEDEDVDITPLNGVWEINSETGYDAYSETCETQAYGFMLVAYLEFNNNKMSSYGGYGGDVYTCPDNDKTLVFTGNSFTDEDNEEWTFEISGNTLTMTAKQADHGCYAKVILTKASESDIENAISSCENE